MPTLFNAIIGGERGLEWQKVIGRRMFPIHFPPVLAQLPRLQDQPVYMVKLDALSHSELIRIAEYLAQKVGMSTTETLLEIMRYGIPILQSDTTLLIEIHEPPFPPPAAGAAA